MNWRTDDVAQRWWNEALADFGHGLGFENFSGGDSEVHNFAVADDKYLVDVECSADDVILAVFTELPADQVENKLRLLLRCCHFDRYLPFFVQAGLKDSNVAVLAVRLQRTQAHKMFQAFELIRKLYVEAGL